MKPLLATAWIFCLTATLAGAAVAQPPAVSDAARARTLDNLRAFAKLYGYVRWFHPGDAAAETDWDAFARHGVEEVRDAETPEELRRNLEELFAPIAPTVQIHRMGEAPEPLSLFEDASGVDWVAWQHAGVDVGFRYGIYKSRRLYRVTGEVENAAGFTQAVEDATPYRGMEARLRAAVRVDVDNTGEDLVDKGGLWLQVNRASQEPGFFDAMEDRPITSSEWATYEIIGPVAEDATQLYLGGFLEGSGTAWFDRFELAVRATADAPWRPVPLENAGFEEGRDSDRPPGWGRHVQDASYRYTLVEDDPRDGERVFRIDRDPAAPRTLFEARPEPGEAVDKPLGRGLAARVPLSLPSRGGHTARPAGAPSPDVLRATLARVAERPAEATDPAVRLAGIVIAWNVFEHFYPYFDRIEADWDAVLTEGLRRAVADDSRDAYLDTLRWLTARLEDGHAGFYPEDFPMGLLPTPLGEVEGEVVVVAVPPTEECVRPGDRPLTVDGRPVDSDLERGKRLLSGSPQWVTHFALTDIGRGAVDGEVVLEVERDGAPVTCRLRRVSAANPTPREARPEPFAEPRPGIFYVDLTRIDSATLDGQIETLAEADGVVFDVRGYPRVPERILQHLSGETLRSVRFEIPQVIYPDGERVTHDDSGRWTLPPLTPRIGGDVVFLIDAGAISAAESLLGIVEEYELGELMGSTTAGANGNVNRLTLPGGFPLTFTGLRVRKHDGSPHHLVGIQPTIPVERTLAGVRAGRDEVLEAALDRLSADR